MSSKVLSCVAGIAVAAGAANAATVAYWAFPVTAPAQNFNIPWPIPADLSANPGATLDTDAPKYDGSAAPAALAQGSMQYFSGSAVNLQSPFVLGQGLSMRNDSLDRGQNKSMILHFSSLTYTDLVLSYAERYTATGPTGITIQYSTDGTLYTPFTTYATVRDGNFATSPRVIDLSAVDSLENLPDVYLKITFTGFNVNGTGTARIDNVLVSTAPTPGAVTVLGVAGLFAGRRRR